MKQKNLWREKNLNGLPFRHITQCSIQQEHFYKNYREKSHYCLIVALKHLYVETGKLSISFIEGLQKGKSLREDADYYDDWSKIGAEEMVNMTKEFLEAAKNILKK